MKFAIYHGRLSYKTGPTDIDGNPVDDWGFDGPVLEGVKALDFTYGQYELLFISEEAKQKAKKQTGWLDGVHEHSLRIRFRDDCVSVTNYERKRREYFGDFLLTGNDHDV